MSSLHRSSLGASFSGPSLRYQAKAARDGEFIRVRWAPSSRIIRRFGVRFKKEGMEMRDRRFVRRLMLVAVLVGLSWSVLACVPAPQKEGEQVAEVPESGVVGPEFTFDQWAQSVTDLEQVDYSWVFIQITGPPGSRKWRRPNTAIACRTATAGCGSVVTWKWLPPEIEGATLRIERKEGQPDCFDPVELPPNPNSRTVKPGCPIGPWLYKITCISESPGECPPEPLDPRIQIEN
jgi:hypothetical protein